LGVCEVWVSPRQAAPHPPQRLSHLLAGAAHRDYKRNPDVLRGVRDVWLGLSR